MSNVFNSHFVRKEYFSILSILDFAAVFKFQCFAKVIKVLETIILHSTFNLHTLSLDIFSL